MKRPTYLQLSLASLLIPFLLWPIIFRRLVTDFWTGLAIATALLLILSLGINRRVPLRTSSRWFLLGAASGLLLYGFFYLGYQLTKGIGAFSEGVNLVYTFRTDLPLPLIALLLLFPIGFGEEVYWRGLIQRSLADNLGYGSAWILQAIPYTLIHLFALDASNAPLLITALIGGLAWGYLYRLSGSISPSILSHVIFDLLIFVVLPFI